MSAPGREASDRFWRCSELTTTHNEAFAKVAYRAQIVASAALAQKD